MTNYGFPIGNSSFDYDAARVAADLRALPDGARRRSVRQHRWVRFFGHR